jgi:antitoxin YefM
LPTVDLPTPGAPASKKIGVIVFSIATLDFPYAFTYNLYIVLKLSAGAGMPTITITEARSSLYQLFDSVAESHEPMLITGKRTNAVLISEEDWRAIHETLYLLPIPGMRESIREGLQTPIDECSDEVEW